MRPYYVDFDKYRSRGPYRRLDEPSPCQLLAELLRGIPAQGREWRRRLRARHELANLDARALRDIGASPGDVYRECAKPFWRA